MHEVSEIRHLECQAFPPTPLAPILFRESSYAFSMFINIMSVDNPPDEYEQANVHDVYKKIASHFSATRYKVGNSDS